MFQFWFIKMIILNWVMTLFMRFECFMSEIYGGGVILSVRMIKKKGVHNRDDYSKNETA